MRLKILLLKIFFNAIHFLMLSIIFLILLIFIRFQAYLMILMSLDPDVKFKSLHTIESH